MSELVDYSKIAQNSKYHLITYNMPVKPSIFLNYKKDYADLILEDNISELKDAVKRNKDVLLIVKNKNMINSPNNSYVESNFLIVKTGKKYSLYKLK